MRRPAFHKVGRGSNFAALQRRRCIRFFRKDFHAKIQKELNEAFSEENIYRYPEYLEKVIWKRRIVQRAGPLLMEE